LKYSYVAVSDCEITKFIISSGDYISFFKSTPQIAMNVLLTMKEGCIRNINTLKNFDTLYAELEKISDNMILFKAIADNDTDNSLLSKYLANGGIVPPAIDSAFLLGDYSTIFNKTYGTQGFDPKAKYQWKKT
jgi:hypothetical protein